MDTENDIRYTLDLDIRYGICYNKLQCRLLSRIDTAIKIAEVLLGSTAFVSFFNNQPKYAGLAGLALAAINAVKFAVDFGGMAAQAELQYRRFSDLLLVADSLPLADLKRHLQTVQSSSAPEIETLRIPAHNQNLTEQGRDDCLIDLSFRERVMKTIS